MTTRPIYSFAFCFSCDSFRSFALQQQQCWPVLSPTCCHAPAACNMTPRGDAAHSSLLFPHTLKKNLSFHRSTEPLYAPRAQAHLLTDHVGRYFWTFERHNTTQHNTTQHNTTQHTLAPLTQLSRRTMVCGCRINLEKSKPPPASEAPYALAPPVSSMSLPFSRFLWRSPRGSELTWGDSLPAWTKLNLNYRPPPPRFCSTWRRRKRRATRRSCAGGCAVLLRVTGAELFGYRKDDHVRLFSSILPPHTHTHTHLRDRWFNC